MLFGDNAYIHLASSEEDALKKIIALANLSAKGYKLDGNMISFENYYDDRDPGVHYLPALIKGEGLAHMILAWLKEQQYDSEPDHDGSNKKGYQLAANYKGFTVRPHWIRFGK